MLYFYLVIVMQIYGIFKKTPIFSHYLSSCVNVGNAYQTVVAATLGMIVHQGRIFVFCLVGVAFCGHKADAPSR